MDNKWSGFESQLVLTEVWACGVMVALKKGQSWYSNMALAQLVEHCWIIWQMGRRFESYTLYNKEGAPFPTFWIYPKRVKADLERLIEYKLSI